MSLEKDGLKAALMDAMDGNPETKEEAMGLMAGAIVNYFKNNLEVKIPAGGVIVSVTGGSGSAAKGDTNDTKISCEVS